MGDEKAKCSSLGKYAAEHWADHARFEKVSTHIEDGIRHLHDPEKPYFEGWLDLYDIDKGWYAFTGRGDKCRGSPLYYASLCGLHNLTAHLVAKHPEHVNATSGRCLSPLAQHCTKDTSTLQSYYISAVPTWILRDTEIGLLLHAALVDGLLISRNGYSPMVQTQ
jgi:hypothetical protein